MSDSLPLVTVKCNTYNHAPYIRQCLEGFVMQQTNFKFEVNLYDDASTDGTTEIVKEYIEKYPHLFRPFIQKVNLFSTNKPLRRKIIDSNIRGKYIAFCEGDDYWIDPLKLQKQVDFLEANPDYGLCHTRMKRLIQKTGKMVESQTLVGLKETAETLLTNYYIYTLTTMYRADLYSQYCKEVEPQNKGWLMGDTPMFLWFLTNSKIKGFEDITGVYRILEESASHTNDRVKATRFLLSSIDMGAYFIKRYNIKININQYLIRHYTSELRESGMRSAQAFSMIVHHIIHHHKIILLHPQFWCSLFWRVGIRILRNIKRIFIPQKSR
ncbi:MAG: glycosyltransferase [Rikenellaceae bacterium]